MSCEIKFVKQLKIHEVKTSPSCRVCKKDVQTGKHFVLFGTGKHDKGMKKWCGLVHTLCVKKLERVYSNDPYKHQPAAYLEEGQEFSSDAKDVEGLHTGWDCFTK